jgi:predicted ATPase
MYLLDEPEAALSPTRQLTFLSILHQLASMKVAQFTLPGATVLSIDEGRLREVSYKDTEHGYVISRHSRVRDVTFPLVARPRSRTRPVRGRLACHP